MELSERYKYDHSFSFMAYMLSNQVLGMAWKQRNDLENALKFCNEAESVYHEAKIKLDLLINNRNILFVDLSLIRHKEFMVILEHHNIDTLDLLHQVYELLNEDEKAIKYAVNAQKKRLEHDRLNLPLVVHAINLAAHFISKGEYEAARHHLACCSYAITYLEKLPLNVPFLRALKFLSALAVYKQSSLKFWGIYGLALLQDSVIHLKALRGDSEKDISFPGNKLLEDDYKVTDKPEVLKIQNDVNFGPVTCFDEAKLVFQHALRNFQDAQKSLGEIGNETARAEIAYGMGVLWIALAYFETDDDRKCKMNKRCIVILENISKEFPSKAESPMKQNIFFHVAEAYITLVVIKAERLKQNPNSQSRITDINKIRTLSLCSISNAKAYITIVKEQNNGTLPEKLPEKLINNIMFANYAIAKAVEILIFHCKYDESDNLILATEGLKYVITYLERQPEKVIRKQEMYNDCRKMLNMFSKRL